MADFPIDIEYAERGRGQALLFVPGSFATGAGWKLVMEKLGEGYRFISTSLLGYGRTAERRPLGNATMAQQTEMLDSVLERIAAPTHIVAHSYGALSALAHALNGHRKALSLVLVAESLRHLTNCGRSGAVRHGRLNDTCLPPGVSGRQSKLSPPRH